MGYEGCIAHWRGKNGEITADIIRDSNGELVAVTDPKTGVGIPLYLLKGSKSFSIEHPQSNLFDI